MTAAYLIRLDDACPTMCAEIWGELEQILDENGIRPIVGVIPENRDPNMECAPADPYFWAHVRNWQNKGWTIALHGLHHVYHSIPYGARALVPIHDKSEFVGLSLEEQKRIIRRAYACFIREGIRPTMFMAPSHTFDRNTLEALRCETDIRIITDGYSLNPYQMDDFTWIPQQLWRLRTLPMGLWTVALHPNTMTRSQLLAFKSDLVKYKNRIGNIEMLAGRPVEAQSVGTALFRYAFITALKLKRLKQRWI